MKEGQFPLLYVTLIMIGGLISNDDIHVNNELVMHDEVYLDYGDADIDCDVNCVMDCPDAENISDNLLNLEDAVSFDGCVVNEAAVNEEKEDESDSHDWFETGDDWEIDFSEHDNSDGNGLSDDDADDDEDAMQISSGDKIAMERSEVKTKIQAFVLTLRRKSLYSNGQLPCQAVSMVKDYYGYDY